MPCCGTGMNFVCSCLNLFGDVNMYMVCRSELRWAILSIPFTSTELIFSCLTLNSKACPLGDDTPCISVHGQE